MAISPLENLREAGRDFWQRRTRSLITIIGVILGTMSVMVVLAITQGINKMTQQWMNERGGTRKLSVHSDWENDTAKGRRHLSMEEFNHIRSLFPDVHTFNPTVTGYYTVTYGNNEKRLGIDAVLPDYCRVEEWYPDKGRFINDYDVEQYNQVLVLGSKVATHLFGNEDPLGKTVSLTDTDGYRGRFTVIGVMKKRYMKNNEGNFGNGDNMLDYMNDFVFCPLGTAIKKMNSENGIRGFDLKADSEEQVPGLKARLQTALTNIRHGEKVFKVDTALEDAEKQASDSRIFTVVFTMISAISLMVGGIVIMNIMLATVQERRREIGVRLTVGARRSDIFWEFLAQTVVTTLLGGAIGVGIGFSMLEAVGRYLGTPMEAGGRMALVGLLVAGITGVVFGMLPAWRAARLNPVDVLHEI